MNVPWETVRNWTELRLKFAQERVCAEISAEETAQLRTQMKLYRQILELEKAGAGSADQ